VGNWLYEITVFVGIAEVYRYWSILYTSAGSIAYIGQQYIDFYLKTFMPESYAVKQQV
jgi:hypothetical protein